MDRYGFPQNYVTGVDEPARLVDDGEDALAGVRLVLRDMLADLLAPGDKPPAAALR